MLQKIQISQLNLQQLKAIDNSIEELIFAEADKFLKGEPYAPSWKKDPKHFKKVISQMVGFKRDLAGYFDDQSDNWQSLVDYYNPDDPFPDPTWSDQTNKLAAIIEQNMGKAYDAGVTYLILLGLLKGIDHSSTSTIAQKNILKAALEKSQQITDTTQKRIKAQLKTAKTLQTSYDDIQARIQKVLDNPNRERFISEDASVQAIMDGQMNAASEAGLAYKTWDGPQATDHICGDTNGEIVPIDEDFSNGLPGPKAHMNCRCGIIYSDTKN